MLTPSRKNQTMGRVEIDNVYGNGNDPFLSPSVLPSSDDTNPSQMVSKKIAPANSGQAKRKETDLL